MHTHTHKHTESDSSAALESSLDLKTKQTSASALCPPPPPLSMPSTTLFSICIWSFCCWLFRGCASSLLPLPWLLLLVNWIKVQMLAINITKKLMPHVCAACGAVSVSACLAVWLVRQHSTNCGLWHSAEWEWVPFRALYNYNWNAVLTNRQRGMQRLKLVLAWCAP